MVRGLKKSTLLAVAFAAPVAVAVAAAPIPRMFGPVAPGAASDSGVTESYCDARDQVAERLRQSFEETPVLAQVTETDMIMELWASDVLGTWTMVHHSSDGISCIVTSGTDWAVGADATAMLNQAVARTVHQS